MIVSVFSRFLRSKSNRNDRVFPYCSSVLFKFITRLIMFFLLLWVAIAPLLASLVVFVCVVFIIVIEIFICLHNSL